MTISYAVECDNSSKIVLAQSILDMAMDGTLKDMSASFIQESLISLSAYIAYQD